MLTQFNSISSYAPPSGVTASFGYSPPAGTNYTQNVVNAIQAQVERGNDPIYVAGRIGSQALGGALEAAFGPPPPGQGYLDVWIGWVLTAVWPEWMNNFGSRNFTPALLPRVEVLQELQTQTPNTRTETTVPPPVPDVNKELNIVKLYSITSSKDLEKYREKGKFKKGLVVELGGKKRFVGIEALELIFNKIAPNINSDNMKMCLEMMRDLREQASTLVSTENDVIKSMDKNIKSITFLHSLDERIIEEAKKVAPNRIRIPLEQGPLEKNIQTQIMERMIRAIIRGEKVEFEFRDNMIFAKMNEKEYPVTKLLKNVNFNHMHFDEADSELFLQYLQKNIQDAQYAQYRPYHPSHDDKVSTVEDFRKLGEVFKANDADKAIENLTLGEQLALNMYTGDFFIYCNSLLRGFTTKEPFNKRNSIGYIYPFHFEIRFPSLRA